MRIFLLTKTPQSERTRLCLRLLTGLICSGGSAGSDDVVAYLAGDGVYNLIGRDWQDSASLSECRPGKTLPSLLPGNRIIACREDLLARGVPADVKATVPANFYELLVIDMMVEGSRIYTF
jgi:sulfur transfer complex TusBCD TusB component (DsrH family)